MTRNDLDLYIENLSILELENLQIKIDQNLNRQYSSNYSQFSENPRLHAGVECPHCHSKHVSRNGKHNEKQRYICVNCEKTFGLTTNSILAWTKKSPSVWFKYSKCMINGFSLRKSAIECGINIQTAFNWRHKILQALTVREETTLSGIIESDETYFPDNFKGNCNAGIHLTRQSTDKMQKINIPAVKIPAYKTFRESGHRHSRGKDSSKRGLSKQKVCVPCAIDRKGKIYGKVVGLGKVSEEFLHKAYDHHIEQESTLVTDKDASAKKFAKKNNLELIQLNSKTESRKGLYNLQHVNNLHSQLKTFVANFKNVSTKHLDNYVVWLGWTMGHKGMNVQTTAEKLLQTATSVYYHINCAQICKKPAYPFSLCGG
jgi:transposase-like protein